MVKCGRISSDGFGVLRHQEAAEGYFQRYLLFDT